jgi:hypothetical protein
LEQSRRRTLALIVVAVAGLGAWGILSRRGPATAPAPAAVVGGQRVIVEVLNGSGRRGLARAATRELRRAGFDVISFGTISDTVPLTEALVRRGDSTAAVRVIRALGVGRVRLAPDTLLRLDVTVRLGDDYHPPAGIRP